jgi:hypothetical protein
MRARHSIALQDHRNAMADILLARIQSRLQIEDLWEHSGLNAGWGVRVLHFAAHAPSDDNGELMRGAHLLEAFNKLVPISAVAIERIAIEPDVADAWIDRPAVRVYLHGQFFLLPRRASNGAQPERPAHGRLGRYLGTGAPCHRQSRLFAR